MNISKLYTGFMEKNNTYEAGSTLKRLQVISNFATKPRF
jgi:hypothetical protein